ncbi:MAG: hypothetical protein IJJ94_02115 [Bacteroidaceae bacterium]|nr:hypothetical protein [Bacteroidaceae bacterium]
MNFELRPQAVTLNSKLTNMGIFAILAIVVIVVAWWQHIRNRRHYK